MFKENGLQVLEDAYNAGVRFFDTSPRYGLAEQLLFSWLVEKNDPSITVATKWGYTYIANFAANVKPIVSILSVYCQYFRPKSN